MEAKKLKRLKFVVWSMYVLNMTAFALATVTTLTCAYFGMVMPAAVSFVPAVANAIAVILMDMLHDAIIKELDEREEQPKNNIVALFPARNLYSVEAYEAERARTEAD